MARPEGLGADSAEKIVSRFYDTVGWGAEGDVTEDARRYEDLREIAREYVSRCRLRVLQHIPAHGEALLDMASGPIQFAEYLEYSRNFAKRYCVDLSAAALAKAESRIGDHGVFLHGNFLDLPLAENFFDCAVSMHTIYHIDKDRQEEAVRKLLRVTKPGRPVIIVYSNPDATIQILKAMPPFRLLQKALHLVKGRAYRVQVKNEIPLYFHAHPLGWWDRFRDVADVRILPWRSLDSVTQKRLIPNHRAGKALLALLFRLEDRFPNFFARYFQYSMIVLTKRA